MIVCVKISIDFMWLFPTWLIIFIGVEIGIGYDVLKCFDSSDKLWDIVEQVQGSV